jgi:hypothetical protein
MTCVPINFCHPKEKIGFLQDAVAPDIMIILQDAVAPDIMIILLDAVAPDIMIITPQRG